MRYVPGFGYEGQPQMMDWEATSPMEVAPAEAAAPAAAAGKWGMLGKLNPYMIGGSMLLSAYDQAQKGKLADWQNKMNADLTATEWARGGRAPAQSVGAPYLPAADPLAAGLQTYGAFKNADNEEAKADLQRELIKSEIDMNKALAGSAWGRLAAPPREAAPTEMPSVTEPAKSVPVVMPEPTATVSTEEAKPSLAPKPAVKAPKIMQAPAPVTRGSAPAGTSGWGDLAKPAKIPKYLMRNEVYDNIYNRPQKR